VRRCRRHENRGRRGKVPARRLESHLAAAALNEQDLKQIAMFAWLPFLAADLGCMFGGTISITLQKYAGMGLINARRCAFTVGALMMTGVALVGTVENPYVAVALLSLAGFAHQTLSVTVITMASDLFKRSEVATVAGMAVRTRDNAQPTLAAISPCSLAMASKMRASSNV